MCSSSQNVRSGIVHHQYTWWIFFLYNTQIHIHACVISIDGPSPNSYIEDSLVWSDDFNPRRQNRIPDERIGGALTIYTNSPRSTNPEVICKYSLKGSNYSTTQCYLVFSPQKYKYNEPIHSQLSLTIFHLFTIYFNIPCSTGRG